MNGPAKLPRKSKQALDFTGVESMTKQSMANGTKVDQILRQYQTRGVNSNDVGLFQRNVLAGEFGIADTTYDYQTQLNRIIEIKEKFGRLPSSIRDKFRNDPAVMLRYMADPANMAECVKMKLFRSDEAPKETGGANTPPPPPPAQNPTPGTAPKAPGQ